MRFVPFRCPPPSAILHNASLIPRRPFSACSTALAKPLPPRRVIDESEIIENFLKGSGPGGQKINKTSSAVQLKHIPTGIVVKYQDTRSRAQNRKVARKLLGERVEELEKGEGARTAIRAREKGKKKASADKKKRRKYRALETGKEGTDELDELDEEGEGDEGEVVGGEADEIEIVDHDVAQPEKPVEWEEDGDVRKAE
ncbi:hypothetical protein P280DRAFT_452001 [Massarina eburnea CBS 473.64]|uniref:Prokaryotic-type class I peptide chain release factors domain-containing protein n=1 Tax=Massarina eburnea CBS 473.64 TaxID=1395130 RepID=A0A6A6S174_9PLEO|nr:hypothetical protein P280DRAFT_452001 [Massarina eburnea CBS 473.64]